MPAMSPTMTEGGIANWKVKEGDTFSTGDVLLEIETDKAQMDVEAQEDGKMAKITQKAGGEKIKVGTRIAILAESDDDLASLELPSESTSGQPSPAQTGSTKQAEDLPPSEDDTQPQQKPSQSGKPQISTSKPGKQTYPLYPSVASLLHEKGLPISEADNIPASGPKGRLLKGDVLAYLGRINSSYSSEQSARITKLGHLDLSNVESAPPKEETPALSQEPKKQAAASEPEPEIDTEIAVPISLTSVLSVQKRIQDTLGVTLPLSTFIARATELANEDLPMQSSRRPSTDELFNDIVGLNKVKATGSRRGNYVPQITALPTRSLIETASVSRSQPDVYDILAGKEGPSTRKPQGSSRKFLANPKPEDMTNIFSVTAGEGDEKRARVFLERVKTILQVEPGRLIL